MTPLNKFQFTPLREGRLPSMNAIWRGFLFQFTPLREGRRTGCDTPSRRGDFNSRPSARGDKIVETDCMLPTISIHAPPRGATRFSVYHADYRGNFNSRPSARGDPTTLSGLSALPTYFNSRPSARGDHALLEHEGIFFLFQFTPLREGRQTRRFLRKSMRCTISIHAPPRGATNTSKIFFAYYLISIHAPPRGATNYKGNEGSN